MDPDIDFAALMERFDTFLIGRKTFEAMRRMGGRRRRRRRESGTSSARGRCGPSDCPHATLSDDAERVVAELRTQPGKDIALFGGGELFRSLLAAGLVDEVGCLGDSGAARRRDSDAAVAGRSREAQAEEAPGLREDRHGRPRVRHRPRDEFAELGKGPATGSFLPARAQICACGGSDEGEPVKSDMAGVAAMASASRGG